MFYFFLIAVKRGPSQLYKADITTEIPKSQHFFVDLSVPQYSIFTMANLIPKVSGRHP